MDDLKVKIHLDFVAGLTKLDGAGVKDYDLALTKDIRFDYGTATTAQANLFYNGTRTLTASSSETLDLSGVLTDPFGDTITSAEVVAIYVSAATGNTNSVVIGNAASNGFVGPLGATGTYTIKPGEYVLFTSESGWAVTAATGDLLKVANSGSGTSVTYTIVIVARTVAA
jgi:hypothetical protein